MSLTGTIICIYINNTKTLLNFIILTRIILYLLILYFILCACVPFINMVEDSSLNSNKSKVNNIKMDV